MRAPEEMASGEGDPSKLEKRRNQLSVARKARQIFKSGKMISILYV
jgi:hypothetical protein